MTIHAVVSFMLCSHGPKAVCFVHSSARSRNVAVLGGGISGMVASLKLARELPSHRIVLIEKDIRLGGFVGSEREHIGQVSPLLELGPRSIRPVGYKGQRTLELVRYLLTA